MKRLVLIAAAVVALAGCGFPRTDPRPEVHIEVCPPYCQGAK